MPRRGEAVARPKQSIKEEEQVADGDAEPATRLKSGFPPARHFSKVDMADNMSSRYSGFVLSF
jgi:hypothetical protein